VLERRLGRNHSATEVETNHVAHLLQRGLLKEFRNGCAGVVYQNIKPTEGRDDFFDGGMDSLGIGSVRLDSDSFSAAAFNRLDDC